MPDLAVVLPMMAGALKGLLLLYLAVRVVGLTSDLIRRQHPTS